MDELNRIKQYFYEKSYQLCLDLCLEHEKSFKKGDLKREFDYYLGVCRIKLYHTTEGLTILEKFFKDGINDSLKINALIEYVYATKYYYGIYESDNTKKMINAIEIIAKIKDKDITQFKNLLFDLWLPFAQNSYYKKVAAFAEEFPKLLKPLLKTNEEFARYYYQLGYNVYYGYGETADIKKAEKHFLNVVKEFKEGDYYADSAILLNQIYSNTQDFVKSLEVMTEVKKNLSKNSQKYLTVENIINGIVNPLFSVYTNYTFLPNNKPVVTMNWKNCEKAEFKLYKIENVLKSIKKYSSNIISYFNELDKTLVLKWDKELINNHDYKYHVDTVTLDILPPGMYILEGMNNKEIVSRTTVNITENATIIKMSPDKGIVYVVNAITGIPVFDAKVVITLNQYDYSKGQYVIRDISDKTDQLGVVEFDINFDKKHYYSPNIFAACEINGNIAFSNGYAGYYYWNYYDNYSSYSYTDRPAYRPGETVYYKSIIRLQKDGEYKLPDEKFTVWIYDAKGQKVEEKICKPDEFGTISGSFETKKDCPLGQYTIYILNKHGSYIYKNYGYFRVEEYKLPEFNLTIKANDEFFKPGDNIKVEIDAQYYFGGAVKDAEGEVIVYEQPYYHYFTFPREYYWYYNNWQQSQNPYAQYGANKGTQLKTYKIKTDENGKAYIEVPTKSLKEIEKELKRQYGSNFESWINNRYSNHSYFECEDYYSYRDYYYYYYNYYYSFDRKYHIEVKVTDKSRREIEGFEDIKVTKNPFYVYMKPDKYVYMPNDNINMEIRTVNANNIPVIAEGDLKLYKSIFNKELNKYDYELVKTIKVKTEKKDKFIFTFKIESEGHYFISFDCFDNDTKISGNTNVYISNDKYAQLNRDANIEIIPDKDFYKPNEKAKVLITTKYPDSFVLLSIEGDSLFSYQIEYIKEGSKIVYLSLSENMTPNVLIKGCLITNLYFFEQQKEIIIPPMDKFITVLVEKEKETYQPNEEVTLKVKTLNYKGEGIKAQVSIGVIDASVYYIQSDYSPDILQFYYSERKQLSVKTTTSFASTKYYNKDGGVDEKQTIQELDISGDCSPEAPCDCECDDLCSSKECECEESAPMAKSMASVTLSSPSPAKRSERKKESKEEASAGASADKSPEEPKKDESDFSNVAIRENFKTTAYWSPSVITDKNGEAIVKFNMPENLTQWKITAKGIDKETRVGDVKVSVKTKKTVLVRLQAPRFFLERDKVTISGNVHNYSDNDGIFFVKLDVKGGLKEITNSGTKKLEIKAGEDKRVDYEFEVVQKGEAEIILFAKSDCGEDAMKLKFPIKVYGMLKTIGEATNTKDKSKVSLFLPKERIKSGTNLSINISPSIAAIMIQSLDYLAQYPYGCVEQTMSRFLPTVTALKSIKELGLDISFYNKDVPDMVNTGLKRLYDFQLGSGGWGWWKDDTYNQYMTSYVLYGLLSAKECGVKVDENVLSRGVNALTNSLEDKNDLNTEAYALYALSHNKSTVKKALERVYDKREKLSAYSKALLAITMYNLGETEKGLILLRNLENHINIDKENQTAYYGNKSYWYWYDGDVESTSFALKAYLYLNKESERIPLLLKWLVYNRNGNRWSHTKDTANVVYALTDYLKVFKEHQKEGNVKIILNNKEIEVIKFDPKTILNNLSGFNINLPDSQLIDGENIIEVKKSGSQDVYYSVFMDYFSQEDFIKSSGFEVFVERKYRKIINKNNKITFADIKEGDILKSGDRIEVELLINSKNNYEYILVDDYKPSGTEPARLTSGLSSAGGTYANMEIRDDKTVFFITYLSKGNHSIKYELKAEIPGYFHSLPTKVEAMYVPQIKGNSNSTIIQIEDK